MNEKRDKHVGAGLLAKAVVQLTGRVLTHRFGEHARSHIESAPYLRSCVVCGCAHPPPPPNPPYAPEHRQTTGAARARFATGTTRRRCFRRSSTFFCAAPDPRR